MNSVLRVTAYSLLLPNSNPSTSGRLCNPCVYILQRGRPMEGNRAGLSPSQLNLIAQCQAPSRERLTVGPYVHCIVCYSLYFE